MPRRRPARGPCCPRVPYLDWGNPAASVAQLQKFRVETRADYHYFAPEGSNPLGFNQIEFSTTLAIPVPEEQAVDYAGLCHVFLAGAELDAAPAAPADMPADTFDAYLDAAWNPHINDRFGGELSLRGGVYSDFRGIDEDSIRLTGTALAVMQINQVTQFKLGIWYLNRVQYKLLPTFGVVWSPNPDVRFDILFPNPKYSQRLNDDGRHGLVVVSLRRLRRRRLDDPAGQGARTAVGGQLDEVDYNDIRIALGLEFKRLARVGTVGTLRDRRGLRPASRLRQRRTRQLLGVLDGLLRAGSLRLLNALPGNGDRRFPFGQNPVAQRDDPFFGAVLISVSTKGDSPIFGPTLRVAA